MLHECQDRMANVDQEEQLPDSQVCGHATAEKCCCMWAIIDL